MSLLNSLLQNPLTTSLAAALAHFLWQGTIVALVAAIALRCLRHHSPGLRYAVACVALLIMLALPVSRVTIEALSTRGQNAIPFSPVGAFAGDASRTRTVPRVDSSSVAATGVTPGYTLNPDFKPLLPWLVIAWFLGVAFLSVRLLGGWLVMRRLRRQSTKPLASEWQDRVWLIGHQMRVSRPVRLLDSALVSVPTAIGCLNPIILLPLGALTGLTTRQLEAIIAHEVAHIRRHDYLVNLLQSVIETLLFYHPAVWWVSRQIRLERELCCDDLAVTMCSNPLVYARALLEMEQLRASQPRLAMAANGGLLMNRITRLTGSLHNETARSSGLLAGVIVVAILVSAGVVAQVAVPSYVVTEASAISSTVDGAHMSPSIKLPSPAAKRHTHKSPIEPAIPSGESASLPTRETSVATVSSDAGLAADQSTDAAKLTSANPNERAAVACALGRARSVESIAALVDLLSDDASITPIRCWSSGDWSPAHEIFRHSSPGEQAAIALASFGEVSVEPLVAALNLPNPAARSNAAWALGEIRGGLTVNRDTAIEPLIVALSDAHPWVRAAAAFSLGEMRPRVGVPPLIVALGDSDAKVREMAAGALGEMKSRRAVEGLSALLRDQNQGVRRRAAWSLGEIKDASALEALSAALNDIDLTVRATVKRAISEIRN